MSKSRSIPTATARTAGRQAGGDGARERLVDVVGGSLSMGVLSVGGCVQGCGYG